MKLSDLSDLFENTSKETMMKIGGGVVIGILGFWILLKIFHPYTSPLIKNACRSYLGIDESGNSLGGRESVKVEAARVEKGVMTKRIPTVGILRANHEVMLRSETAGRIKEILFKEGEAVNQGDLLIQFEDGDVKAELEQAKAELAFRQGDFERSTKLKEQKLVSQYSKVFDEARSGYEQAKARVDKAEAQLEKTKIFAPFSGHIGLIKIDAGEYVQPNTELVKLVDYTPMKVNFKIPEKYLHELGVGQLAEVRLDGFPNEVFIATIEAIEPSVQAESHSIGVTALIPNDNQKLRSGLYANISVIVGEKSGTLMVPEAAVNREGGIEFVWVIQNGKARFTPVLTGTRENAKVEIITGLREGLMVITAAPNIVHGTPVSVINQPTPDELLKLSLGTKKEDKEAKPAEVKSEPIKAEEAKSTTPATPQAPDAIALPVDTSIAPGTPAPAPIAPAATPIIPTTVPTTSETKPEEKKVQTPADSQIKENEKKPEKLAAGTPAA